MLVKVTPKPLCVCVWLYHSILCVILFQNNISHFLHIISPRLTGPSCRPIRHHWCANASSHVSMHSSDFRKLWKFRKRCFCSFLSIDGLFGLEKFSVLKFQVCLHWTLLFHFKKLKVVVGVWLYNALLKQPDTYSLQRKSVLFSSHVIRDTIPYKVMESISINQHQQLHAGTTRNLSFRYLGTSFGWILCVGVCVCFFFMTMLEQSHLNA